MTAPDDGGVGSTTSPIDWGVSGWQGRTYTSARGLGRDLLRRLVSIRITRDGASGLKQLVCVALVYIAARRNSFIPACVWNTTPLDKYCGNVPNLSHCYVFFYLVVYRLQPYDFETNLRHEMARGKRRKPEIKLVLKQGLLTKMTKINDWFLFEPQRMICFSIIIWNHSGYNGN